MQPNFSLIFFTTLAGMAQGLIISIALLNFRSSLLPGDFLAWLALPVALALLIISLLASFFHLGHPERAWRAMLMWRTSWLSREVLVLPLFIAITGLAWLFALNQQQSTWLWLALIILAIALWVCTAQIYQCIHFIQEWANPLTLVNFIALGLTSGWLLFASLIAIWPTTMPAFEPSLLAGFGFILLFICLNIKLWIWRRNQRLKPTSNLNSATGIKNPQLRQTSMGLMGGSFNTREFFHQQSNLVISNLRKIIFFNAYFIPMIVLAYAISAQSYGWIIAAFMIHCSGLLAERWMFFAEANHPQNLYYQRVS